MAAQDDVFRPLEQSDGSSFDPPPEPEPGGWHEQVTD
jgi:hypothetical protein